MIGVEVVMQEKEKLCTSIMVGVESTKRQTNCNSEMSNYVELAFLENTSAYYFCFNIFLFTTRERHIVDSFRNTPPLESLPSHRTGVLETLGRVP